MRLATLFRRTLPATPLRAGVPPIWDRPDPPSSTKVEHKKRLSVQDKHFSFFDASSPTFMLVNSQVAEGNLAEAFPNFIKRFGALFLTGFLVGIVGFIWGSRKQVETMTNYLGQVQYLAEEKERFDTKYGLKDLQNNPWKLNSWPECFPAHNLGEQGISLVYSWKQGTVDTIRQMNKEGLGYWNSLRAQAEEGLKNGGGAHH